MICAILLILATVGGASLGVAAAALCLMARHDPLPPIDAQARQTHESTLL